MICPPFKRLQMLDRDDKIIDNENFYPDELQLFDDNKIAHLKKIRLNTQHKILVRLFSCQNMKDRKKTIATVFYMNSLKRKPVNQIKQIIYFFMRKNM